MAINDGRLECPSVACTGRHQPVDARDDAGDGEFARGIDHSSGRLHQAGARRISGSKIDPDAREVYRRLLCRALERDAARSVSPICSGTTILVWLRPSTCTSTLPQRRTGGAAAAAGSPGRYRRCITPAASSRDFDRSDDRSLRSHDQSVAAWCDVGDSEPALRIRTRDAPLTPGIDCVASLSIT